MAENNRPIYPTEINMNRKQIVVTGKDLTIEELDEISEDDRGRIEVVLDPKAVHRIEEARKGVEKEIEKGKNIYGTTTRTGPEKERSVPVGQKFQREIAAGYGGR